MLDCRQSIILRLSQLQDADQRGISSAGARGEPDVLRRQPPARMLTTLRLWDLTWDGCFTHREVVRHAWRSGCYTEQQSVVSKGFGVCDADACCAVERGNEREGEATLSVRQATAAWGRGRCGCGWRWCAREGALTTSRPGADWVQRGTRKRGAAGSAAERGQPEEDGRCAGEGGGRMRIIRKATCTFCTGSRGEGG